jgi:hypothetical protein
MKFPINLFSSIAYYSARINYAKRGKIIEGLKNAT